VSPPRAAEQAARPTVIRPACGCRAISRLANETVVTRGEPHPTCERGAVAASWERVVLAGRATRLPQAAGHQRNPADNHGHSKSAAERTVRP
jgi:hypothetical protein